MRHLLRKLRFTSRHALLKTLCVDHDLPTVNNIVVKFVKSAFKEAVQNSFAEEQILEFLKQPEAGGPVAELCRKGDHSSVAFYRWRQPYGVL